MKVHLTDREIEEMDSLRSLAKVFLPEPHYGAEVHFEYGANDAPKEIRLIFSAGGTESEPTHFLEALVSSGGIRAEILSYGKHEGRDA